MALAGDRLDKALVALAYAADELDQHMCSRIKREDEELLETDLTMNARSFSEGRVYSKFHAALEEWREANLEWQEDTWNNKPLEEGV